MQHGVRKRAKRRGGVVWRWKHETDPKNIIQSNINFFLLMIHANTLKAFYPEYSQREYLFLTVIHPGIAWNTIYFIKPNEARALHTELYIITQNFT